LTVAISVSSSTRRIGAFVSVFAVVVMVGLVARRGSRDHVACGPDFFVVGARCCPGPAADPSGCLPPPVCPPPLVLRAASCDAPDERVRVPETTLEVGPSDWEAEGRVASRTVHAGPFDLDAFEATVARFTVNKTSRDGARAASGVTRAAAIAYCKNRLGRLPTEDEWIVAAAGPSGHRYPWGDTGAVCRRAAWGLATGPCATDGQGPDTVGTHPNGDTASGLHDMAGNVAEWVAPGSNPMGIARGGSWKSALATELRTWGRLELDPDQPDSRVGVRCAYDVR
jgi:formylglycine-generating enzyme